MTNPDVKPVYVCVALGIDQMTGMCVNQPLNANNAQGTPFDVNLNIVGAQYIEPAIVDDTGKATSTICWEKNLTDYVQSVIDETLECGVEYDNYCEGEDICVNKNWWFDRYNWTIDRMYVWHASYQYNTKGVLSSVSPICRECIPPGDECGFTCTTMADTSSCQSLGLETLCYELVTNPATP